MESIAEIWKDIQGYEGLYQVSNFGRVKGLKRSKIRKLCNDRGGYLCVSLKKQGTVKLCKVHRLVAVAFIPNPENKPQIDHINAIKTDNTIKNLRWVSAKENVRNPLNMAHFLDKSNPKAHKVKNIDTNEIFNTVKEASIKYNVSHSAIVQAIKKNRKCSGCHWEYV